MSIFDLFRKKTVPVKTTPPAQHSIPDEEKKHYQPDSYYTDVTHAGTPFERKVITFEERKKTAIPSVRGLYPAEILLLDYCAKGTYPGPKNGYPGFWWFAYGIRDVGAALKTLESRGFVIFASPMASVKGLTITQLKELLVTSGQPVTGKKAELVERVMNSVSESDLIAAGVQPKYILTPLGQQELNENAYVPYMHSTPHKTTEDDRFGTQFNVWSINKLLGTGDKSNWRTVVEEQERKHTSETAEHNASFMEDLKKIDPEGYRALKTQDEQLAAVQTAKARYAEDKDLGAYIAFWEMVWNNGGLTFEGAGWHFELADLYIKAKRYDDALVFVTKLKRTKPTYAYKSDVYIKKIAELKAKQTGKK